MVNCGICTPDLAVVDPLTDVKEVSVAAADRVERARELFGGAGCDAAAVRFARIGAVVAFLLMSAGLCGCASSIIGDKLVAPTPSRGTGKPPADLVDAEMRFRVGPPDATLYAWRMEPRPHTVFRTPDDNHIKARLDQIDTKWSGTANVMILETWRRPEVCIATPKPGKSMAVPVKFRSTVILIQGWGTGIRDGAYLEPLAACLSNAGCRVIYLDLRAQGDSTGAHFTWGEQDAKDISQVIDQLQASGLAGERIILVGHSYGAGTAIAAAAADPRISAVVALSPPPALRQCRSVASTMAKVEFPLIYFLLNPFVTERTWQEAVDRAGQIGGFDPDKADPCLRIRETSARVLLMHGGHDQVCPVWASKAIHDARPEGTEFDVWPDDGHSSYLDREEFLGQVLGWLAR